MSQGKAWNKEEVIRTLEPFFKLGCNPKKACEYAGIPYTTVATWLQDDEELRMKVTAWQHEVSNQARQVLAKQISENNPAISLEWMKRKEKDEFSDRQEHTGPEGGAIELKGVDISIRQ
jgi:hypothetical protein